MSRGRVFLDYLNDILEAVTDIEDFTAGMALEAFLSDKKTGNAVIRSLEVIGEAASKIPLEIRNRYPEIPWVEIIAMRNYLIHAYFGVDKDIIWRTLQEDLPPLKESIERIIANHS